MVSIPFYDEDAYEKTVLGILKDLGYTYYNGYEVDRDYHNPLFVNDLDNIYAINAGYSNIAIKTAIKKVQDFGLGSLKDKNDKFMDYLQNGISVNYWEDGKEKSTLIKLDINSLYSTSNPYIIRYLQITSNALLKETSYLILCQTKLFFKTFSFRSLR